MALLFVFEGPDGVGKTTLISSAKKRLQRKGIDCVTHSFPGKEKGGLGRHIYELHHCPERFGVNSLSPASRQILHIAAHVDAIQETIRPLLHQGKVVLLDRYWWSTWAYGTASNVPEELLQSMLGVERIAWGEIHPSVVFLVNRPEAQASPELLAAYVKLTAREASRYRVVQLDNQRPLEQTLQEVTEVILEAVAATSHHNVRPSQRGFFKQPNTTEVTDAFRPTTRGPLVFASLKPAVPTEVYNTYWRFAAERQAIFFRQLTNAPGDLTRDRILRQYKFTNAYRASDRVSQFLIREVIYAGDQTAEEVFFRTILFKLFNRIETWRLLERAVGPLRYADFNFDRYDDVLTQSIDSGRSIYSAAYIMPTSRTFGVRKRKHSTHLKLLERMMVTEAALHFCESQSMREAFELLKTYPMLGDFLAYQFVIDLNYSELVDFDEMEFVVPGPGARDGLHKCFRDAGGLSDTDLIRVVADRQEVEFSRLGLEFQSLWGRRLQLVDIQNLFCEVDKYARLAHPEFKGISGRTRIKQLHRPKPKPIPYWYPPKWGINSVLERELKVARRYEQGVT